MSHEPEAFDDRMLWPGAGPLSLASAIMVMTAFLASMEALPSFFIRLLLLSAIIWVITSALALWQRQYLWVLAGVPFVAIPVDLFAFLITVCSQRDCM